MTLCECGCGQEIIDKYHHNWRGIPRFIRGHNRNRLGRTKENDASVRRQSEKMRGRTKETYPYLCERAKKQSKTMKRKFASGEIVPWQKGLTKETHEGIRCGAEKRTGRTKETHKGLRQISKKAKKRWQDPEYREKNIKLALRGFMKRPTSFEQRIIDLINKHNLSFKYVGDGEVIIGGKCPDFIETNGKKILIEVYCSYIKERFDKLDNYEQDRYDFFREFGFKTIFLNDTDLFREDWEEHCLNKINGMKS